MNAVFPFGFPLPTGFYLTLYVLTLVVHLVFMNYCLGGSLYLACSLWSGRPAGPAAHTLRDWLPFALSAAITAGVAPLLFVQLLYKQHFYSANLLLLHRWMSLLGVLIVGFYAFYLLKSAALKRRSAVWLVLAGTVAFACIAFTGFAWTENHMLSRQPELWPEFYASGRMWYHDAQMWPRFGVWFFAALPTTSLLLSWQLRKTTLPAGGPSHLARVAGIGLLLAMVCGVLYAALMPAPQRTMLAGRLAGPYTVLALLGIALQCGGWWRVWRTDRLDRGPLWLNGAGVVLTLLGLAVLREALRLATIDIEPLYEQHAAAAQVGGKVLFLAFALLNGLLVAWCIQMVRRHARPAESETPAGS